VNPGENIAIIGKNASGKTTIIKLLLGFYGLSQ
jgi:ABC-type bacteriocin/lantibiotic exporter with double-glycine peptidase domain